MADPSPASMAAGGALVALGLVIRAWAAGVLDKDRRLAVSGPYAHARHPLYLGSLLIAVGGIVAGRRLWFGVFALAVLVAFHWSAATREEAGLARRFGESYRRYRASVPSLLPRLRGYRHRPDAGGGSAPVRPSAALYARNREWEALVGAAAAFALLALKAAA